MEEIEMEDNRVPTYWLVPENIAQQYNHLITFAKTLSTQNTHLIIGYDHKQICLTYQSMKWKPWNLSFSSASGSVCVVVVNFVKLLSFLIFKKEKLPCPCLLLTHHMGQGPRFLNLDTPVARGVTHMKAYDLIC